MTPHLSHQDLTEFLDLLDPPPLPVFHDPAHVVDGTVPQVSSQEVAHELQIQREHLNPQLLKHSVA